MLTRVTIAPLLERQFTAIESFGILFRNVRFDSAQAQQRAEGLFLKPVLAFLRLEAAQDEVNLLTAERFREANKEIGRTQVAIVFRNLVFQNQMVPETVPGQLADQAMILVQVAATMREN